MLRRRVLLGCRRRVLRAVAEGCFVLSPEGALRCRRRVLRAVAEGCFALSPKRDGLPASVRSTLPRQLTAPCRESPQHRAAKSTAPYGVRPQHSTASASSTLRRQRPAPYSVQSAA